MYLYTVHFCKGFEITHKKYVPNNSSKIKIRIKVMESREIYIRAKSQYLEEEHKYVGLKGLGVSRKKVNLSFLAAKVKWEVESVIVTNCYH